MVGVLLTETNYKTTEEVEQVQTACMCGLILHYAFRSLNRWSQTAEYGLDIRMCGMTLFAACKLYA